MKNRNDMIPLYEHQQKVIDDDRLWSGIFYGTGGGKTRTVLELAEGPTLIIVPKQQKLDRTWEKNRDRFGIAADTTVISKEEFRLKWASLPAYITVIVDEAHNFFGVSPDTRQKNNVQIPRTSQMFDALHSYIKKTNPKRFYLCTATPVSKPMNLFAIGTLMGKNWDFFKFREKYYVNIKQGYRSFWIPRDSKDLKNRLAEVTKTLGYTGRLSDWFDVPEQTHITRYVELTGYQKKYLQALSDTEADPMTKRAKQRTIENGCLYSLEVKEIYKGADKMVKETQWIESNKFYYIKERAEEFKKILIFANYTGQIESLAHDLREEGYKVLTLTGQTKDREHVIEDAEKSDTCIVIAQCSVSAGYELKTFDCVIFASKSYRFLDYEQGIGRVLRADALKKNLYIHLVVRDSIDELCHETIMSGKDFQEKIMS